MRLGRGMICALCIAVPSAALAQDPDAPPPAEFTKVLDCRELSDGAQRLACYDSAVGALAEAQRSETLVVVSREDVREARRGLFGFSLPKLKLFGGGEDKEEAKEVTATVESASRSRDGWVFRLGDAGVWEQTDGAFMSRPEPGDTLVIRKASFGSYFARLNDRVGFRIKRVR